jgi:hypothetical protein
LVAPAGAYAHDEMCGGGGVDHGGGGGAVTAQGASIPAPPYDQDCDLIADGSTDPDGSGPVKAGPDNCPGTRNGDQTDTDDDGEGDACDSDDDGDGIPDTSDNCRTIVGNDPCPPVDSDGDAVYDHLDNCRNLPNPSQANTDGDRQGDACDADDDDDYILDESDNCPVASNQDQVDADRDGVGDACDPDTKTGVVTDPDPGSNDHSAPRVRLRLARIQRLGDLLGGMATSVRCSEACAISGQLRRGRRAVAKGTATLAGAGRTWLFLRLRGSVARRLIRGGGVRASLRLTVTDSAGNATHTRRTVVLRP